MTRKVGRNDPCPCGSGKKYKQCCMLKEQEATAAKYTPSGKRKFKAKLLSGQDKSLSIFGRSTAIPQEVSESSRLEKLKFQMTEKDFRVKEGETTQLDEPFHSEESEIQPEAAEEKKHQPGESFEPATQDFRTPEKESEE